MYKQGKISKDVSNQSNTKDIQHWKEKKANKKRDKKQNHFKYFHESLCNNNKTNIQNVQTYIHPEDTHTNTNLGGGEAGYKLEHCSNTVWEAGGGLIRAEEHKQKGSRKR